MAAMLKKTGLGKRHTTELHPRRLLMEPLEDRRLLSAAQAAEAINLFALDVYEHMQREEGNLFFSPLSVATGLAMAYAGAAGQTAAEIEQVVHLGSAPNIHASFADLMDSIESHNELFGFPNPPHMLTVANAIWPDDTFTVQQSFIDTVEGSYSGHVQAVDYGDPQQAEDTINQWVANNTFGKIPELVSDLSAGIRMILTNAVYFNGYWDAPFDPRYTEPRDFTLPGGQTISVPTMYTELTTSYATFDDYRVLELPFDGGHANADYSMVLVLPPESGDQDLSGELVTQIDTWLDESPSEELVLVTVPKLDIAVSTGFNQLLMGLGMPAAFDLLRADFSGMTPEPVAISKVFHKATLTVNEQGTTAAGATEIDFYICFAAGTPVLTPNGSVAIENLKAGDLVLARDENNLEGALEPKVIEKVHRNEAEIVELRIQGQTLRTTAPHPVFVHGKGWTPVGELSPGDKLSTSSQDWIEVEGIEFTRQVEPVYNFRVADFHTYFVQSKAWDFGVWVHNACGGEPEFFADRPFHLIIRDNITDTIAFVGRIDNPVLSQNEINPIVVTVNSDFDGDGLVGGSDFLAWQRGHGTTENALLTGGDSDEDGDVDGDDLANWERSFGNHEAALAAMADSGELLPHADLDVSNATVGRGLIDAAMARSWLQLEARDRALATIDAPAAPTPDYSAPQGIDHAPDDQPVAPSWGATDRASSASGRQVSTSPTELDDDPLDLPFE